MSSVCNGDVSEADLVSLVQHRRPPQAQQHDEGHTGPCVGRRPPTGCANRDMSWFDPVHAGQAPLGKQRLGVSRRCAAWRRRRRVR